MVTDTQTVNTKLVSQKDSTESRLGWLQPIVFTGGTGRRERLGEGLGTVGIAHDGSDSRVTSGRTCGGCNFFGFVSKVEGK